ncbi:MAG: proton-conducting transporter membrane subunit [Bacillota bacterium]|nr:proton-conducting transporter membrane subunit [Bacillota bacterium]
MQIVMFLMLFLILFPLLIMLAMAVINNQALRSAIIKISVFLIAAASIWLFVLNINNSEPLMFAVNIDFINTLMTSISVLISIYIIYAGFRDKKYWASVLAVLQIISSLAFELAYSGKIHSEYDLMLDNLSLIMVLLVGIIGGLICIFAIGYMAKYHHHKLMKDKSKLFFTTVYAFISAMFGLVLSNNLMWLLFFWEITTFCSFVLIGYTRREDSIRNSYRALIMNMAGGLAFLAGIAWLFKTQGIIELDKLMALAPAAAMVPAILISLSGVVKSAQMPFSSWLLGAMVAPTPTSALLHSSTMVKAGVYIIIRLSPLLKNTPAGFALTLIGAITFLLASFIAISMHNVKRLLAYSTISTLGLIVACAGVGTYQAIWTAILLMIFHAVAKSLLFLSVGTVEHGIDSLNIEDMDGLILRMPKVTVCLLIGISGMFLAPFGMLISKWAALEALIVANPFIAFFVVFGSSATLFFYTKWMGKLIMIIHPSENQEKVVSSAEWFTMGTLSALTVLVCIAFPSISTHIIDPYIRHLYQQDVSMNTGNIVIMLIMMALILTLPFQILLQHKDKKHVIAYLCGANITENNLLYEANTRFHTTKMDVEELKLRNYYFENYFGEDKLGKIGVVTTTLLIAVLFGIILI